MKLISALLLFIIPAVAAHYPKELCYIHPKPGSDFHSVVTTIIVKTNPEVDHIQRKLQFAVFGEKSGEHSGSIIYSGETIIFKPERFFAHGEFVTVQIGGLAQPFTFQFSTREKVNEHDESMRNINMVVKQTSDVLESASTLAARQVRMINGVAVPSDFPNIITTVHGQTAPGRLFFASTFFDTGSRSNYIFICENDGTPYFYRTYERSNLGSGEFDVQANGMLTFYRYLNSDDGFYILMDHNFVEIDTFRAAHGYRTDSHEMLLLDNGHALLVCEEDRRMDLSAIVPGGQKNANVIGNHIQEVDSDGNVYWEWRCWDYLDVQDAIEVNTRSSSIDYAHTNSIAIDYDGHYVVSHRSLAEVNKIDNQTGEFIWRFGGNNNEFDIQDEYRISGQHHAMPVPGKPNHYTIYDNGNSRSPQFTRAVEYKLDPATRTAERVWHYRYNKVNFASMMGSVQRLDNGNTYIDWSAWPPSRACEVDADNNLVFEIEVQGISSYRSRRYEWEGQMQKPYLLAENSVQGIRLIFNKFGDKDVNHYIVYGGQSIGSMVPMDTTNNSYAELTDLQNNTRYYFKVTAVNSAGEKSDFSDIISAYVKYTEPGTDLIVNGDFSNGAGNWSLNVRNGAAASGSVKNGEYQVEIQSGKGAANYSDIQLIQESFPIIQGRRYVFEFDAWASNNRVIEPRVAENGGDYTVYSKTTPMGITRQKKRYSYEFEMTDPSDPEARVVLNCGISDINCYFDNISVKELLSSAVKDHQEQPSTFNLGQNYPNPFNPVTTIEFALPVEQFVRLFVYDMRGREIERLVNEQRQAGQHTVIFDGSSLPSGLFLYKLETESQTDVKKMILIK
ncbi:aryl-sulfate sulfotransferase [candidate division KSB1 bacterium]|nr:aryl-sulfate sulfotransferase [candidate division KSB1 bacterium]